MCVKSVILYKNNISQIKEKGLNSFIWLVKKIWSIELKQNINEYNVIKEDKMLFKLFSCMSSIVIAQKNSCVYNLTSFAFSISIFCSMLFNSSLYQDKGNFVFIYDFFPSLLMYVVTFQDHPIFRTKDILET